MGVYYIGTHFFPTKFSFSFQHLWYIDNAAIPDITLMRIAFFFVDDYYFFVVLFSCMFIQGMNQMKSLLSLNLFKQKKFCQQY